MYYYDRTDSIGFLKYKEDPDDSILKTLCIKRLIEIESGESIKETLEKDANHDPHEGLSMGDIC
jgi:hypothetical protein